MVELRSGEKIVMREDCSEDKIDSGYLTLTNYRLIFEKGEARMLTLSKKVTEVALDIPLNNILEAKTEGMIAKKVVVIVLEPTGSKVYKFGVLGTGKWRDTINKAKSQVSSST